uniref:Interleukin family protein n=1 Tax=Sphaeramia orbicularis TaxID=375764 RepID=A0A673C143_9TELE
MPGRCVLLSVLLLLLLLLRHACSSPVCNNHCCRFVESFPTRLRTLRDHFSQIRDYYEANDDLDSALLDVTIEDTFKVQALSAACHGRCPGLYLRTVLPTALAGVTEENKDLKPHMESIQVIFDQLKREVTSCKKYFSCKKPFDISTLNSTYTQMEDKGLYKAMGELDILFNYIETYLQL